MTYHGVYFLQISMSVRIALRAVLKTQNVLILKEATLVPVHLGILETEPSAMVSMTLY